MKLRTVTITGADDSVEPKEIAELTKGFPFVEWGILLENGIYSGRRFPSRDWIAEAAQDPDGVDEESSEADPAAESTTAKPEEVPALNRPTPIEKGKARARSPRPAP